MKSLLVILFFVINIFSLPANGQIKFWEDLSLTQQIEIIKNCHCESLRKFYDGRFIISDNVETEKLLDELVKENETVLPLSFYLLNKIIMESDGSLSEMASEYSNEFLARHPKYVLLFFSRERELGISKTILRKYAENVGYELYFKEKGTSSFKYSYQQFKEKLITSINNNKKVEETFKIFWELVDETINKMD